MLDDSGRPLCPVCKLPMWLVQPDDDAASHEHRFECPVCKKTLERGSKVLESRRSPGRSLPALFEPRLRFLERVDRAVERLRLVYAVGIAEPPEPFFASARGNPAVNAAYAVFRVSAVP